MFIVLTREMRRHCIDIPITNDTTTEATESFTVVLEVADVPDNVGISRPNTTVEIQDDGKCTNILYHFSV